VLLDGAGMVLDEAGGGRSHALMRCFDMAHFEGEADITASLIDGATRDFNVMVRRELVRADVEVWRTAVPHRVAFATTLLLYCAQGSVAVVVHGSGEHLLEEGDSLRIDADEVAMLGTSGMGVLLAVTLNDVSN
jgi:uncharacterized protein